MAERLRQLQAEELGTQVPLDLAASLRQAQQTAREYLNEEEEYLIQAISLLIERHRWSPRLFDQATIGLDGGQTDGDVRNVLRVVNELGVRQRLPFGGEAAARWVFVATENLRSRATGQYVQSSRLALDATVPLLQGAGLIAQESLIQAERDVVYAARDFESFRRDFLVAIARDYFALLQAQDSIESQRNRLRSLRSLLERQREWFEADRLPAFEVNLAANDVLAAESALANLTERYILQLDRFKVRLGLPPETRVEILPAELAIPEPDTTMDRAAALALLYRLDLQNLRDQLEDVRRDVTIARNRLLPRLDLAGGVALPTDADAREGGAVFEPDDVEYNVSLTLDVPLDRVEERLSLRQATIRLQQALRQFTLFRDNLVLGVRAQVREIERARLNLQLAEERVRITELRQEEQQIKEDEVDTQDRIDTENALFEARQARDQAKTDLRNAVLDYLLATGQLRVARDGTFEPLPGMEGGRDPVMATPGGTTDESGADVSEIVEPPAPGTPPPPSTAPAIPRED